MPHLTVSVHEEELAGRETELIERLTDAVAAVYGEWAREIAVVQLVGVPAGRWGVGGKPAAAPAPSVVFGIRAEAFERPDAQRIVDGAVSGVTEAVVAVFGERVRAEVTVELLATPAAHSATGGVPAARLT